MSSYDIDYYLVVASVFSKHNILNIIIAHEQWMGDCHLKAIEDENVIIPTFLAVIAIFVISTSSFLPFIVTYAANIFICTDIDRASETGV